MRELLLYISSLSLVLLLLFSIYLPENKKVTTQRVILIHNEKLLIDLLKSFSCSRSTCNKYYANFLNSSQEISKESYFKIQKGQKISISKTEKHFSSLSIFLLMLLAILFIVILICCTTEDKYLESGEYHDL